MSTDWADFWSFFTDVDMSTIAAFPNDTIFGNIDFTAFDFFKKSKISFFVFFFNLSDCFELEGDFFKTFFASSRKD